jgi:hypothetical protein
MNNLFDKLAEEVFYDAEDDVFYDVEDEPEPEMLWVYELEGTCEKVTKWPLAKFRGTPWWIMQELDF